MTDIQAEINAKEKCQEQLNVIYQNGQILAGDITRYTIDYLDELQTQMTTAWSTVCEIAMSMVNYKGMTMPKPMDESGLISAGIVAAPVEILTEPSTSIS